MPHIVIEYSANLRDRMDWAGFMEAVQRRAVDTGIFALGGIRVRAYAAEHYRIADAHEDNAFVHVVLRVGHGRTPEARKRASEAIFDTVCERLQPLYDRIPLGISLELQEIDPVLSFRKNNLHEYVQRRREGAITRP